MGRFIVFRLYFVFFIGLILSCEDETPQQKELIDEFQIDVQGNFDIESDPKDLYREFLRVTTGGDHYGALFEKMETLGFDRDQLFQLEESMSEVFGLFNYEVDTVFEEALIGGYDYGETGNGEDGTINLSNFFEYTKVEKYQLDLFSPQVFKFTVDYSLPATDPLDFFVHSGDVQIHLDQLSAASIAGSGSFGANVQIDIPAWSTILGNTKFRIIFERLNFTDFVMADIFNTGVFGQFGRIRQEVVSTLIFEYKYEIEQGDFLVEATLVGSVNKISGLLLEDGTYSLELQDLTMNADFKAYKLSSE